MHPELDGEMQNKGKNKIEHIGTVQNVTGNTIEVCIEPEAACASCHVKSVCNASGDTKKIIEIDSKNCNDEYKEGEKVMVYFQQSLGFKALFLGYILPLIILLLTIIITTMFTESELIIGILAIAILIPYYSILFFYRNRIKQSFTFLIRKV